MISKQAGPQSSNYHCLHHDVRLRKQEQLRPGRLFFILQTPITERYLTARGTTTRFHPQYDLSAIQSLSESRFQQLFHVFVHLALNACRLGSNGNVAAVLRLKNLFQVGYKKNQPVNYRSHQSNLQHKRSGVTNSSVINNNLMREIFTARKRKKEMIQRVPMENSHQREGDLRFEIQESWLRRFKVEIQDMRAKYSISLTLVCDVNKKLTSYLASYPGSCHNSYVFSNMQIAQQPEKFFDQNQFLLADSAYKSDWFTLPAYKGKELLYHQNVDFNYHLARSQVRIDIPLTQIRNQKEMKDTIKWIISCVVLHNLLSDLKDQ
ncbi:hypothetical protein VP01_3560g6 [Puccinia sorghi]|uniref:DDE Tnp4 domain-containing protein n=1 Tax=Puccinia sorghi TaxID=27349 RepID=A0A0L6UVG4_9BASI|nr:hypothetical protein VP01_3560g6 [Puccinia sorghi]